MRGMVEKIQIDNHIQFLKGIAADETQPMGERQRAIGLLEQLGENWQQPSGN